MKIKRVSSQKTNNKTSKNIRIRWVNRPPIVHRPTAAEIFAKLCTSHKKSNTTFLQSVLCQLSFCLDQETRRRLWKHLHWVLNICMQKKSVILTPPLSSPIILHSNFYWAFPLRNKTRIEPWDHCEMVHSSQ